MHSKLQLAAALAFLAAALTVVSAGDPYYYEPYEPYEPYYYEPYEPYYYEPYEP
eukprot:CAMPEP_0198237112 /NCGR_PEP_ID=MMETSP1446-20131203/2960_1 /TAXON_ID=1461542 ORGANISM="Unidentified sp, Strain CCMP2111" /NCGR_SAMPLE_ID=MMETSP1446 /ASSEMBLY_ACC=CAM_ASM_001112 /LENGTH=53 /DNA_ID=CAMNT_0043919139 /DNA_START=69 /DNA_END=227 /DNA_ORIENTATION=-